MEPMEDQNCTEEFEEVYNLNKSADDLLFDQIIMQLQQIVIHPQFENTLNHFMTNHWTLFEQNCSQNKLMQIFNSYYQLLNHYLEKKLRQKIPEFNWPLFSRLLKTRKTLIDQQILDTIQSLQNVENFKCFIKDYKNSYEEQERFKVLTIKSNKINQHKTVKSKNNIFSSYNENSIFGPKDLKPQPYKRKEAQQKTQEELLVPNLILTVKSMRKC